MRYWPSQLLPIVFLIILALLSFWLRQLGEEEKPVEERIVVHRPDAIGEEVVARRYDESGKLRYQLTSPYLEHFPDDDSSELRQPVLLSFRPNAEPLRLSAEHARITAKGETVYLTEKVKLVRPATRDQAELVARMPDLTAFPDRGTAVTASPVQITQGKSWVTGVGMDIDNNNSTMVLQSQVRGEYISPRATP